jgi:very-short-patch-repair endonuclease
VGTTRNIVIGQKVGPTMWQTAKQLRRQMTPEEKVLWQHLRAKRLGGLRFRRQQIIGRYIVDFYCHATELVIELDGAAHAYQVEQDQEREAFLSGRGLRVLRFKNQQVREDLPSVLSQIAEACQLQTASPT